MDLTYWTTLSGDFIGAFSKDNPNLPIHAIEVPIAPPSTISLSGNFRWDGSQWITPATGNQSDVQSGRFSVSNVDQYIIGNSFQSIIKSGIDVQGQIFLEGQLFVER